MGPYIPWTPSHQHRTSSWLILPTQALNFWTFLRTSPASSHSVDQHNLSWSESTLFLIFPDVTCADTIRFKRSSTPPPSHDADQHVPVCPGMPAVPRDALPRTMIPPSPGGPRLNGLAAHPKRSAPIRAPPASNARSQTVGVKKPATKSAKTKIKVIETETPVTAGKKTTSLMDLPGGMSDGALVSSRLDTDKT